MERLKRFGLRVARKVWAHYDKLLLATGIFIVVYCVQSCLYKGEVVSKSVPVEATILKAEVEESMFGRPREYEAIVKYRYTYEGETYTSRSIHPGEDRIHFTDPEDAREEADYQTGETVTAYILPSDPETSYLTKHPSQKGSGFGFAVGICAGVGMLLFGLVGVVADLVEEEE